MVKAYLLDSKLILKAFFMLKTKKMTKCVNFMTSLWCQDIAWQNFRCQFWKPRLFYFLIGYEIFSNRLFLGLNFANKKKVAILPIFTIFSFIRYMFSYYFLKQMLDEALPNLKLIYLIYLYNKYHLAQFHGRFERSTA